MVVDSKKSKDFFISRAKVVWSEIVYDTLFARQAIYDKKLKLAAYELLFRQDNMTVDKALINAIIDLKKQGYKLALDDFVINENNQSLVKFADIIKIDVLNLNEAEIEDLIHPIQKSNDFKGIMLAEKIEKYRQFEIV